MGGGWRYEKSVVKGTNPLPSPIGKLISSLWPRSVTTSWDQWASEWALCVISAFLRAVTWLCSGYLAY